MECHSLQVQHLQLLVTSNWYTYFNLLIFSYVNQVVNLFLALLCWF